MGNAFTSHMSAILDKMANGKEKSGENTGDKNRWNRPEEEICVHKAKIQRKRKKNQLKNIKIETHLERLNLFPKRD